MTDDAPLSAFDSTPDRDGECDTGTETGDEENPMETTPSGDTNLSTYAWGEYTCSRCETETERVWRAEGAFVCPDCKSW